ncbi:hypothetical protein [Janthinobacterium lividum]
MLERSAPAGAGEDPADDQLQELVAPARRRQEHAHAIDVVLATAAAAGGAPAASAGSRVMFSCRNVAAPARRRAAAGTRRRPGAGHRGSRGRRAGGAGAVPADDQLQERGGAGQAPCSS